MNQSLQPQNNQTLAEIIQELTAKGITDFSQVKFRKDYQLPTLDGDIDYSIPVSFNIIRLEWETK